MPGQLKTFSKRSGNFRQINEKFQREVLTGMVNKAVEVSPVDTAAYVDSFGFNNAPGFSSRGRPRFQDGEVARQRNSSRLNAEIQSLDLSNAVVFGNKAPHAGEVETKHGYMVFAQARREFTRITREALQRAKQT